MSARLKLVLESGDLSLPEEGRVLLLHPTASADLSALPPDRALAVQPFRPDHEALERRGLTVTPTLPEGERFAAAVVFLPRSKALARALVAAAAAVCDGPLVLDGAKTDGIESLLKDLRRRAPVAGSLSKAHGKIAWVDPAPVFDDWTEREGAAGDFVTLPGVFSADAADPASALSAAYVSGLPDGALGARVVDLGAGWGYLSAGLLRDPKLKHLDIVEADHRALSCARRNVTDPRAAFHWADARHWRPEGTPDTVVTNPPFHVGRAADPELGRDFITAAARMLAPSGRLILVANRQLPYEAALSGLFTQTQEVGGDGRFKILRAERPSRGRRG